MMKWTTKFSTVLGCALAAVFLFTSTMEVGAVPLTSSPSGTTTTTTTDTNAAEDGNADAAAEDNAAEDNAAEDNAAVTAAAGTVTSATVTSSSVNIRSEASTSASVAGKAASGQELTVTGETQGSDGKTWYAVTFDNVSGYIRSDLVEAHVSEATAEPAVDETQETEEPEEEPIVDNSADYSVAFEDDGSGSSAWYLHDNTMGTRYQVSDLLNAEETNKNNQATIDQTAKSMRFVVILMAFVIVVLIIVVTILIIKVRSTYEDYDDYDDDEEDDEDDEDDDEDEEEEEERPRRKKGKSKDWQSKNFLFQTAQRLFPDHLRNDLTLRLVCDCIFIVEWLSIGKIFENAVQQRIGIVAAKRRYRDDFCKIHLFAVGFHRIQNGCFRNSVDLVDHENDRQPAAL